MVSCRGKSGAVNKKLSRILNTDKYDSYFYKKRDGERFSYSAERILEIVTESLSPIKSAVDVGCGTGLWLAVLKEQVELERVKGIDGEWVYSDLLKISKEEFVEADLSKTFPMLHEKFDLAISLEVAEHLPTERAGDFVLFSAAIPFQGGTNHLNEQWQDYWADLFEKRDYVPFSFIRDKIWNDDKIIDHYRQNIVLYTHKGKIPKVNAQYIPRERLTLSVVHPSYYRQYAQPTMKTLLWRGVLRKVFGRALKRSLRRMYGRLTSHFDAT